MTKDQVIATRDRLKQDGRQLCIICDNSYVVYDGLRDHEYLVWDDANEHMIVIGAVDKSAGFVYSAATPYQMTTIPFECIQEIYCYLDYKELIKEINELKTDGLITADQATKMIDDMAILSKSNTYPFTRTMKTYDDKTFAEWQAEQRKDTN